MAHGFPHDEDSDEVTAEFETDQQSVADAAEHETTRVLAEQDQPAATSEIRRRPAPPHDPDAAPAHPAAPPPIEFEPDARVPVQEPDFQPQEPFLGGHQNDPAVAWDIPNPPSPSHQYYLDEKRGGLFSFTSLLVLLVGLIGGVAIGWWLSGKPIDLQRLLTKKSSESGETTQSKKTAVAPQPAATAQPTVEPSVVSTPEPPPQVEEPRQARKAKPKKRRVKRTAAKPKTPPAVTKAVAQPVAPRAQPKRPVVPDKLIADINLFEGPTFVKVGIDVGGHPFTHKARLFQNPFRLVVDFEGLNGTQTPGTLPTSATPLQRIRVSKRSATSARLVIDFVSETAPVYVISKVGNGLSILIKR